MSTVMVAAAVTTVAPVHVGASTAFNDVSSDAYYSEPISYLVEKGVLAGYSDGTFKPSQQVTRAEAAKMIVETLGLQTSNAVVSFSDVEQGVWYTPYVATLVNEGIVAGYPDGTFQPNGAITRSELAKMLVEAFDLEAGASSSFSDVNNSAWYAPYISALVENEITSGTTPTTFSPERNVTRGEASTFLYRIDTSLEHVTVEQVNDSTVTINGTTYEIAEDLKGLFNVKNVAALANAKIKFEASENSITKVTSLILVTSGKENEEVVLDAQGVTIDGYVHINADYTSVKNMVVTDDFEISTRVENSFHSEELTVKGHFIISDKAISKADIRKSEANAKTRLTIEDSTLETIDVNKANVNVEIKGNTSINVVNISGNHAAIVAPSGVKIPQLTVNEDVSGIELNVDVESLTLNNSKGLVITGNGNVDTLKIEGEGNLTLATALKIGNIELSEGKKIEDSITNYNNIKQNIGKINGESNSAPATPSRNTGGGSSGGSGGSGGSDTTPAPAPNPIPDPIPAPEVKPQLSKLLSTKDSVLIGEPTAVDFRVNINTEDADSVQAFLMAKDTHGNFVHVLKDDNQVKLLDDGNQNNGDIMQGDGTYSTRISIDAENAGFQSYHVKVELTKGENVTTLTSSNVNVLVMAPLNEKEKKVIAETNSSTQQLFQNLLTENSELSPEAVQEKVVEALVKNENIKSAGKSDSGNGVWYALSSGALGAVTLQQDTQVSANSMSISSASLTASSLSASATNTNRIGNYQALILSPFKNQGNALPSNEIDGVYDLLSSNPTFNVTRVNDAQVTVELLRSYAQYGLIVLDTHGEALFNENLTTAFPTLADIFATAESKVVFLTGEEVKEENIGLYQADLQTGRIVNVDGYYAITPAFIEYYNNENANSIFYNRSDKSFYNDTMAEAFINSGGQTYFGYANNSQSKTTTKLFEHLLEGETTGEAFANINNQELKIAGNKDLTLITPGINNGSFENGTAGWIGAGDVRTVSQLGTNSNPNWQTLYPTDGNQMGIISSGVKPGAIGNRHSWMYQTIVIPEGVTALKLDYNVLSNEPMNFIGSVFDDKFKATIIPGVLPEIAIAEATIGTSPSTGIDNKQQEYEDSPDQGNNDYSNDWLADTVDDNEVIIAFESINSSYWGQGFDQFGYVYEEDSSHRVDVVFPNGDDTTYMTGWKQVTFDVSEYAGKGPVTLKFQTWDLGDTAYPTAVLLDNIHFTESEKTGVQIGGEETIVVSKSADTSVEYQLFSIDQYGDQWTGPITIEKDENGYDQPIRSSESATWSLKEDITGVSIDENTGVVTVSAEADPNASFIIIATTLDGNKKAEKTISLKEAPSTIEIFGENEISIKDVEQTTSYTAVVTDNEGNELANTDIQWSIVNQDGINGVQINNEGEVTISPDAEPYTSFTIVASTKDGASTVKVVSLYTFYDEENIPSTVDILGPNVLHMKEDETIELTEQYTAIVKDQYDSELYNAEVSWSIKEDHVPGVQIDAQTGLLTVSSEAVTGSVFTIVASTVDGAVVDPSNDGQIIAEKQITLQPFVPLTFEIENGSEAISTTQDIVVTFSTSVENIHEDFLDQFTITTSGDKEAINKIANVAIDPEDDRRLIFTLEENLNFNTEYVISIPVDAIWRKDEGSLGIYPFSENVVIVNNSLFIHLPFTTEVEVAVETGSE